jgi:hypothetical protein
MDALNSCVLEARSRMRHHFAPLLLFNPLVLLAFSAPAASQTVALYVSDYHSAPIKGAIISTKGNGSTSPPSDIAGKTRVVLPSRTQPGDPVDLSLVTAPDKNMR